MNSGRIFTEPRGGEVNILPLFTEIEKNNCFSIYTGSDLNNNFRRKPLKIDLIDLRNTGEKRVYTRHFVFVWLTHYSLGRG